MVSRPSITLGATSKLVLSYAFAPKSGCTDRRSRQERAHVPRKSLEFPIDPTRIASVRSATVCLLIKKEMSILPSWLQEDTENVQPQEDLHEEDVHMEDVKPTTVIEDLEGIRDTLVELLDLVEDLLDTLTRLTIKQSFR